MDKELGVILFFLVVGVVAGIYGWVFDQGSLFFFKVLPVMVIGDNLYELYKWYRQKHA
ncbi:hypothetical protein [Limosilactobacillus equigenerosi]|uniref:Uncharacterized protein n=1 Tax=Limosilactobacillus equigenerosi DSM 18793 = JCM 14505 TaxID=1423742 RepID=A0A0R1UP88_9LACO|nr:hypothetical protein [Limosilactobacillus equigenerosi]KRL94967.1 hypothetical protein FC21_GL001011 [Limosilactobacillus equigenerosi DSM 18793 = JCM 14505]